jgi:hypothetical protein
MEETKPTQEKRIWEKIFSSIFSEARGNKGTDC